MAQRDANGRFVKGGADTGGLAGMTAAAGGLLQAVDGASGAMGGLAAVSASTGGGLARAASSTSATTTALGDMATGSQVAARGIQAVGGALQSLVSGPLPSAGQAMNMVGDALGGGITAASEKAASALSKLGPEGAAAGAALEGLGAVASATVGTLTSLMGTAIELTERATLMRAALTGLAGGEAAGAALGKQLAGIADGLPFAASQTRAWAASLVEVGVAGERLAAQTRAIAAAQALTAVTGGQGGAAAQELFTRLAMGGKAADAFMKQVHEGGKSAAKILAKVGLNVKDLGGELAVSKMNASQFGDAVTRALQQRGAPALEAMMNSWPNIIQRAQAGLRSLFSGLEKPVAPFMAAVKSLFSEFNKGSVFINMLKPIVTSVFSTLFSWGTKAVTAIHKGFLLVLIGGLKAYIAVQPLVAAFGGLFGAVMRLVAATGLFGGMGTRVSLLSMAFDGVMGAVQGLITVLMMVVTAGTWMVNALSTVWTAVHALFASVTGEAGSAGGNIVTGLVGGVLSGAGAFVAAMTSLASQGMAAFTGFFTIKSPSRKMLAHGEDNIAGAATTGVERGTPDFQDAMGGLGVGPKATARGMGPGRGGGGRAGLVANFYNCIFGGDTTEAKVHEWMDSWWEKQAAAGPEPEPAS